MPPYQIFEVEGVPVAFIGVVTRSAADMVIPDGIKKIEFTDETKAVNLAVDELKAKGVRSIAVLAHMTASQNGTAVTGESAELANKADPEVDVIFAAHNHEEVNGETGGALIVQASEYGKAIGVVDVEIDRNTKDIVRKQADIEYVNQENIKPDPATRSLLDQYERIVGPIIGEKVGEAAHDMAGGYSNDGDTPLGNLIADGMKRAMNSDFALMNGGGIRQDLKKGPITWGIYSTSSRSEMCSLRLKSKERICMTSLMRKFLRCTVQTTVSADLHTHGTRKQTKRRTFFRKRFADRKRPDLHDNRQ